MRDEAAELEGAAAALLEETGCDDPPVDAFELADCCGLAVEPWGSAGACLEPRRQVIRLNLKTRAVRQHGLVAHEIGHWQLQRQGIDDTEPRARFMAGALMLPRRAFDRDLTRTAWRMDDLRELHANASAEMIARRIAQLRDAVVSIVDNGRVRDRVASPWLEQPQERRLSRWERDLVERALASRETVHGDDLCYAVPIVEPGHARVIVVCELEQLALRL